MKLELSLKGRIGSAEKKAAVLVERVLRPDHSLLAPVFREWKAVVIDVHFTQGGWLLVKYPNFESAARGCIEAVFLYYRLSMQHFRYVQK